MPERNSDIQKGKFKVRYVVLAAILIVVVFVGIFVVKQRDNLSAMYSAITVSKEEILQKQMENDEKIRDALNSMTDSDMRDLTDEERDRLKNGDLSDDEAKQIIVGTAEKGGGGDKNASVSQKSSVSSSEKDSIISEMYLLRAKYLNAIDGLIDTGIARAREIPSAEWTLSKKAEVADKIIDMGNALENQCDAQMETLVARLRDVLKRNGESTDVISEIRSLYSNEKSLKKQELFSRYYR